METDIRPIDDADFRPLEPPMSARVNDDDENSQPRETPIPSQMFYPPPEMFYSPPPPQEPPNKPKFDLFGDLDKTTYIVIFVAFILGFFMGKTMQPVILRPG